MRIEVHGQIISLEDTFARQLPFATALALNATAQDAQAEIRKLLPQQFKLKKREFCILW